MNNPQLTAALTREPNQFILNGRDLSVKLSLGGADGVGHLRYKNSNEVLNFVGDEIALESTSLGQFATVTTQDTPGIGHTSFTLIIPAVDVSEGSQAVATFGITTLHRTRPSGMTRGQLRTYHLTELRGSATHAEF